MITSSEELVFSDFDVVLTNGSQTSLIKTNRSRFVIAGLINICLMILAFAFASIAANGKETGNSTKGQGTGATVTISLGDYGAVGDGVTDDGPALQSALEALADAGGGNLFVPDGHYVIATPVLIDFSGRAASITIQGTPSSAPGGPPGDPGQGLGLSAEFIIKTGEANDAVALQNLTTLSVENLVFIGDPAAEQDARMVLRLSNINSATISVCEFYGLSTLVAGGAIVYEEGGDLKIDGSAFLGCAGNSGTYTSIVQVYDWTGLSITGTRFVDYGYRPDFFSKTPIMSPFSWLSVGGAAPLTHLSPRRDITIKDVFFDEGAYFALSVRPDLFPVANGGAVSLVYLSQLYVNVTNLGEVGMQIYDADNVLIEESHLGWSQNSRGAVELVSINNAILNQIECVLSAGTIIVDNTVGEVSVINSVYQTLDSHAAVTRVISTADPADGPTQYVNQKYLDVVGHAPDIPGYVYWSEQRARCNDDAQCTTDEELLNYLNSNPAATFSISGRLVDTDGAAIASANVLMGGTHLVGTLTDADGRYTFAGLATSGAYTVTPSKTFYTFNATGEPGASNRSFITPRGDQTADFTGTLARYPIQGRVTDSNVQSIGGVTITLTGGPAGFEPPSQATNTQGYYSFASLPAGYTYSLTATKTFYTFSSAQTLVLSGATDNLDFVGTPITYSIGGTVSDDTEPLSNATITLSGDANRITTTDANGEYRFDGIMAGGDYVLTVSKRHYTFTSQTVNDLPSNQTVAFDGEIIRYTISGSVTEGPNALSGVSLTLEGDQTETVVTSSSGNYAFTVNAGGAYTVTALKQGYAFAPPSAVFTDLDQNVHPSFSAQRLPILLTEQNTNRAIAFNSVSMLREPFDLFTTPFDFSPDRHTCVIVFALYFPNSPTTITAQAEDALGNVYPLGVEFTHSLADAPGVTQINIALNSQIPEGADFKLTVVVDGLMSNAVLVGIN